MYYIITFSYEISNTEFTSWDKEVTNALTDCFILDSSQQLTDVGGRVYNDYTKITQLEILFYLQIFSNENTISLFFFSNDINNVSSNIHVDRNKLGFPFIPIAICQKCKSNYESQFFILHLQIHSLI